MSRPRKSTESSTIVVCVRIVCVIRDTRLSHNVIFSYFILQKADSDVTERFNRFLLYNYVSAFGSKYAP